MKKYFYLVFLSLLFLNSNVRAHPGGHYQKGDGTVFNTWQLKNGKIILGNFSFFKDDKIFVEQEGGIIKPIIINNLIEQDQKLAHFKANRYLAFNTPHLAITEVPKSSHYQWIPLFLLLTSLLFVYKLYKSFFTTYILQSSIGLSFISLIFFTSILFACSKSGSSSNNISTPDPITTPVTVLPKTNTTFIDSAFASFKPALSTRWDDTYFYIASNGIPNHNMMIGITNWQQQVPITQPYIDNNSWSIPLQPTYATTPLSTKSNLMKGAVAVAVNGIPIFNALNNRGEDSYIIGELDNWGGHCGKGDDYHYHAAPLHLSTINGLKPIAFALDGFAVYGLKEPDGSAMTSLDTCHGHIGTNKVYHYHGTTDYPYVVGAMKGKVSLDPSTPAPENQILPQAFTKPVRPATNPLKGASITDFAAVGTNGYLLTYKIGTKNGYVKYSWDASNKYTFILTDTSGVAVTNTYQR